MTPRRARLTPKLQWALPVAVFALAFVARFGMIFAHGGNLAGSPSYDTSVYYAAADALVHGRMPYRDFTLVHPPGIVLALAPFAAVGRLTSDHLGFVVGILTWMALGATNSVLVMRIARRMGFGVTASTIGGLGYAVWFEASRTEYALRLEPLGNFFVLLGILGFVASARSTNRFISVGSGAALGASACVKIWYVVPLLVVLVWHHVDRRPRRQLGWSGAGAVAALVVVNGSFFLTAPRQMWSMVVVDQLGRGDAGGSPLRRAAEVASSGLIGAASGRVTMLAVAVPAALAFVALCALAWRSGPGRLVTAVAAAQLVVLMAAPIFFTYYPDYPAPAMSLVVAAAAATLLTRPEQVQAASRRLVRTGLAWAPVVVVGTLALAIDLMHPLDSMAPAPVSALQRATAGMSCVQSNTPMALIQLNVLSRDLANGCQQWVDVTGRSYEPPLEPTGTRNGRKVQRATYPPWQAALRRYLLSGDAVVILDPSSTGISARTLQQVQHGTTLGRSRGYVLHRT